MEDEFLNIIITTVVPGIVSILFNFYFKHKFDKKLKEAEYKHGKEITELQHELNILKDKQNLKFTKLYEKQFTVLEEIYKKINLFIINLETLVHPVKNADSLEEFFDNEDELNSNFLNNYKEFRYYYMNNKIYFEKSIQKIFDNFFEESSIIYEDYIGYIRYQKNGGVFNEELFNKHHLSYKNIRIKLKPIKEEIEEKFIELLNK